MLTEKLEYITEEKNADAKFFEDTINSTKTIILETVLGAREKGLSDRSKNADKTTSETSIQ